MEWKITRLKLIIFFFFFFSAFALLSNTKDPLDIRCHSTTKSGFSFQEFEKALQEVQSGGKRIHKFRATITINKRRILSGPGSWPPRCTFKCGNCTPCKPVHVSVPPSTPVTTEYYPEAWRCKCGNRLYMP